MQDREKNNDPSYETDVPQYRWNNRIRLPIDKKVSQPFDTQMFRI
ncbi:MAG: hypothetical protein ACLR5K_10500 [Acutalibacteraceae bacterium]